MNRYLGLFICLLLAAQVNGQKYLSQKVSIQIQNQPISIVFQSIIEQAGFYFSYNSNLIPKDSLVTISIKNESVESTLNKLFGHRFQYKEQGNHIIILPSDGNRKVWLSGILSDAETGERINYASIFEEGQLVSTLSNPDGSFQLQLKGDEDQFKIRIRKMSYKDTVIQIRNSLQRLQIQLQPQSYLLDSVSIYSNNNKFESSWLGRLLLSSKLRTNSLNLGNYIASRPYQVSLIPGIGTHGRMSTQINNKFSLNVLGGYTAGVQGFEVGGLFNIVKHDMDYAQVAGLFNIVNGAGNGVQIGGIYNSTKEDFNGIQIAGITNYVGKNMDGVQIGGLVNRAKTLHGFQFAVLNFVDSSDGFSLGILNFIKNGYKHKFTISNSETQNLTIGYKTGNDKLYNIIQVGLQLSNKDKAFSFSFGLGHQSNLSSKISLNSELLQSTFYLGNWSTINSLNIVQLKLKYRINPDFALFVGPAISFQYDKYINNSDGYKKDLNPDILSIQFSKKVRAWLGWNIGIELF